MTSTNNRNRIVDNVRDLIDKGFTKINICIEGDNCLIVPTKETQDNNKENSEGKT